MDNKIDGYLDDMFSALTEDGVFIDYDDCVMIRDTIRSRIAEFDAINLRQFRIFKGLRIEAQNKDQRIAELEAEQVTLAKDAYHRGLQDGRDVPDDLLQWLFDKATYAGAWGDNYDQAEAILAKRKENQ